MFRNGTDPWARRVVTIGFSGSYTEKTIQHHGVALLGKQFARFEVTFRLLMATYTTRHKANTARLALMIAATAAHAVNRLSF